MVSFQKKGLQLKYIDKLKMLVEKFTMYSWSAPHKYGRTKLKDNMLPRIHGPTECNQGVHEYFDMLITQDEVTNYL